MKLMPMHRQNPGKHCKVKGKNYNGMVFGKKPRGFFGSCGAAGLGCTGRRTFRAQRKKTGDNYICNYRADILHGIIYRLNWGGGPCRSEVMVCGTNYEFADGGDIRAIDRDGGLSVLWQAERNRTDIHGHRGSA